MCENVVMTSAPAKIILFGEHFVVYGSMALSSAIGLRTFCRISSIANDGKSQPSLKLRLFDISICLDIPIHSLPKIEGLSAWNNPPKFAPMSTVEELFKAFPQSKSIASILYLLLSIGGNAWLNDAMSQSLLIEIVSQFKPGAGLGSSAAFHVSLVCALLKFFNHLQYNDVKGDNLSRDCEERFSKSSLDLVNRWAYVGESVMLRFPSGIDNFNSVHGGVIKFSKGIFETIDQFAQLKILIVNSHVTRCTEDLVSRVLKFKNNFPQKFQKLLDTADKVSAQALELIQLYTNCTLEEHKTTIEKQIEHLIDENQSLLDVLSVSHESLKKIFACAKSFNFHSKITGGGGGGCVLTFINSSVPNEHIELFKKKLHQLNFSCYDVKMEANGVLIHRDVPKTFFELTEE